MKYLKMLGLAAVAAMALTAFFGASSASATVTCTTNVHFGCGAGWKITTSMVATQTEGTTAILETTGGVVLDTCTGSKVEGEITNPGGPTETVSGNINSLLWGTCSRTTHTLKIGSLEVHNIAGTNDGTLTATGGTEVTINTIFGSCIYGTGAALDIGRITGGTPAILHTNSVVVPKVGGNAACPAHGVWNATFTLTNHHGVWVTTS